MQKGAPAGEGTPAQDARTTGSGGMDTGVDGAGVSCRQIKDRKSYE